LCCLECGTVQTVNMTKIYLLLLLILLIEAIENIRLIGGKNELEGRLEIYHEDSGWGTVCDEKFSKQAANVICQSIGATTGKALCCSNFGRGRLDILYDGEICSDSAEDINDCSVNSISSCSSNSVISVICTSEELKTPPIPIRVVDGRDETNGRVEIFHNHQWGTICGNDFSYLEAAVVCRQLGFSGGFSVREAPFGENPYLPIHTASVTCTGIENRLDECQINYGYTSSCDHAMDVGVFCSDPYVPKPHQTVRLIGGNSIFSGRVEIYKDGVWGTVCGDYWTNKNAEVVCRQLGMEGGVVALGGMHGEGIKLPIIADNVFCQGNEERLEECSITLGQGDCSHKRDVSVYCDLPDSIEPEIPLRLAGGENKYSGHLEVFRSTRWGTVCDAGFDNAAARVVCKQLGFTGGIAKRMESFTEHHRFPILLSNVTCSGNEVSLDYCKSQAYPSPGCSHSTDVSIFCNNPAIETPTIKTRLISDDESTYSGRLEIFRNGIWGTVCSVEFDALDAEVVCRELGLTGGRVSSSWGETSQKAILATNLECTGIESSLEHCAGNFENINCGHSEDVSVHCIDPSISMDEHIRLTGWNSSSHGRLEINNLGYWGTIYSDGFNAQSAAVVCREAGLVGGIPACCASEDTVNSRAPVIATQVECFGDEDTLLECTMDYQYLRPASRNVHVFCESEVPIPGPSVRLIAGARENEGRLEVRNGDGWATVCDHHFTEKNAQVVCKQLGYTGGEVKCCGQYGQGLSLPLITQAYNCNGNESSIQSCEFLKTETLELQCDHKSDVAIVCSSDEDDTSPQPIPEPAVRLSSVDSTEHHVSGIVEIYDVSSSMWGTVCAIWFDNNDASVICNQLGMGDGLALAYSNITELSVVSTRASCTGVERKFQECITMSPDVQCTNIAGVRCDRRKHTYSPTLSYIANMPSLYPTLKPTAAFTVVLSVEFEFPFTFLKTDEDLMYSFTLQYRHAVARSGSVILENVEIKGVEASSTIIDSMHSTIVDSRVILNSDFQANEFAKEVRTDPQKVFKLENGFDSEFFGNATILSMDVIDGKGFEEDQSKNSESSKMIIGVVVSIGIAIFSIGLSLWICRRKQSITLKSAVAEMKSSSKLPPLHPKSKRRRSSHKLSSRRDSLGNVSIPEIVAVEVKLSTVLDRGQRPGTPVVNIHDSNSTIATLNADSHIGAESNISNLQDSYIGESTQGIGFHSNRNRMTMQVSRRGSITL